jgi:hypothetical protein
MMPDKKSANISSQTSSLQKFKEAFLEDDAMAVFMSVLAEPLSRERYDNSIHPMLIMFLQMPSEMVAPKRTISS